MDSWIYRDTDAHKDRQVHRQTDRQIVSILMMRVMSLDIYSYTYSLEQKHTHTLLEHKHITLHSYSLKHRPITVMQNNTKKQALKIKVKIHLSKRKNVERFAIND